MQAHRFDACVLDQRSVHGVILSQLGVHWQRAKRGEQRTRLLSRDGRNGQDL